MSLKIEQRLADDQFTETEPRIYSTGVFLVPMRIILNGIEKWVWIADMFENDTFVCGKTCIPNVLAGTKQELLTDE